MTKEIKVYSIVSAVLFTLLAASLFRLQVIKGEHYKRVAESNFVRIRHIIATRGEIYDHKYRPIVQNIPAHNLFLTSGKIRNIKTLAQFLNTHFQIEEDELLQMVQQQRFKTYEEILLADNIPYEKVLSVSEDLNYYPELVFRIGSTRNYMFPNHISASISLAWKVNWM